MYTLNTILFSLLFTVLACTVNVSSVYSQGYDDPASPDYQSRSPYDSPLYSRPSMPLSPGPNGQYQIPESQAEYNYRNEHSSGQPHKPSDQFTAPVPRTETFSVWKDGQLKATCTRSGNSVFCQ